ncbi:MAG: hypothetical protein AB1374_05685 [Bacillota bacterium]
MLSKLEMVAKAKEIKERSQKDPVLADRLTKEPGAVICEEILNPQVIASSGEPSPTTRCTCLPGFSCGSGCQGLVGIIEGTYGCESGNPI